MLNQDALDINLSELQKTLDAQGVELVDNQKESVVGRKSLAEKTKGATFSLTHQSIGLHASTRVQTYPRSRAVGCY